MFIIGSQKKKYKYSIVAIISAIFLFDGYSVAFEYAFISYSWLKIIYSACLFLFILKCGAYTTNKTKVYLGFSFIIVLFLNAFIASDSISTALNCVDVLSWFICALLASMIVLKKRDIYLILQAVKYSSVIECIILLANNKWFAGQYEYDMILLNINRNSVITFVSFGLVICGSEILICKKRKLIDWACFLTILIASLQANSRGLFVVLVIEIASVLIYYFKTIRDQIALKRGVIVIIIVLVALLFMLIFMPDAYVNRLWSGESYSLNNTNRIELWKKALSLTDNPVFGMGSNYTQQHLYHKTDQSGYGAHNLFVDMFVNHGFIPAVILLVIILLYFRRSWLCIALYATPFFRCMVESGRNFSVWGALIIIGFIINRMAIDHEDFDTSFLSILSGEY